MNIKTLLLAGLLATPALADEQRLERQLDLQSAAVDATLQTLEQLASNGLDIADIGMVFILEWRRLCDLHPEDCRDEVAALELIAEYSRLNDAQADRLLELDALVLWFEELEARRRNAPAE